MYMIFGTLVFHSSADIIWSNVFFVAFCIAVFILLFFLGGGGGVEPANVKISH